MTKTKKLSVHNQKFNRGAVDFESWFKNNKNLFYSELNALKEMISDPKNCVSIGIGNGLFAEELGIKKGVEPSIGMAELARAKGINVKIGRAEDIPLEDVSCSQVLLGTILAYVEDKEKAVKEAYRILKKDGEVIISILPAEGAFAMLYRLTNQEGFYDKNLAPRYPYPMEFIKDTEWISSGELLSLMKKAGFKNIKAVQTLLNNPKYSDQEIEKAVKGYKMGSYVVFKGVK